MVGDHRTTPGPIAQAADAIARSAELRRRPQPRPDRVSGMSSIAGLILAGAAVVIAVAARGIPQAWTEGHKERAKLQYWL